jgi:hypothetical protein
VDLFYAPVQLPPPPAHAVITSARARRICFCLLRAGALTSWLLCILIAAKWHSHSWLCGCGHGTGGATGRFSEGRHRVPKACASTARTLPLSRMRVRAQRSPSLPPGVIPNPAAVLADGSEGSVFVFALAPPLFLGVGGSVLRPRAATTATRPCCHHKRPSATDLQLAFPWPAVSTGQPPCG